MQRLCRQGSEAHALEELKRSAAALAAYDELVSRFGAATALPLRELVAMALVNKGVMLGALQRSEEEIAAYDEVVARFGSATALPLREQVVKALVNKGFRLGALNCNEEETAVYDEVLAPVRGRHGALAAGGSRAGVHAQKAKHFGSSDVNGGMHCKERSPGKAKHAFARP